MTTWQLTTDYKGVDVDPALSWRNVNGSAVLVVTWLLEDDPGYQAPRAGIYSFTVLSGVATVMMQALSNLDAGNPLLATLPIVADGVSENLNLIPGVSVILAPDLQAGDQFDIGINNYLDTDLASWYPVLSFGPRVTGFTSTERIFLATNISLGTLTDCLLVATNAVRVVNDVSVFVPFEQFRQVGILNPTADDDLSGLEVTFDNFEEGTPNTVDILVDGETIDIYDVDADDVIPEGVGLNCDGTTVYRFADGTKYQSVEFVLSADLEETDTATLFVSDGGASIEIAQVVSETVGEFISGPSCIVLTESGQADGTVTSDGDAGFAVRIRPPGDGTTDLNQRSFSLRMVGVDGTDATVTTDYQGTFVMAVGEGLLNFNIHAVDPTYTRPRYSETEPDVFELDTEGVYVEDESAPGSYILATEDPNDGNYPDLVTLLAAHGVTYEGA